ncbi:hypothetical protein GCM10020255_006530 [Rhodococcus baikonurensis]
MPELPSVTTETTPTHCRCVTPDWYHDGLDSEFDGRLCRQCRLRQDIPYRDLIDSPKAPATIGASVIGVAAAALRSAMNVLDPHEGGDWEDAWHTIADLEDCASRAETIAQQENPT